MSAVVSKKEVLGVPAGDAHGSTYGGNPLACAVARAALAVIRDERLGGAVGEVRAKLLAELQTIQHPEIKEIRGRGLLIGIELTVPATGVLRAVNGVGAAVQGDACDGDPVGSAVGNLG